MKTPLATAATLVALAGCAPAAAQQAPADPTPDVYRVSPEHAAAVTQETPREPPFIQVSGQAEVSVPSDRARVSFAVVTEAANARSASEENARRMDAVMSALREIDARGLEIETFGYDLVPRYRRGDGQTPTIDGYRAVNNVRVTVDDVEAVGRLIDAAIGAGANRVASLTFEASDTGEARAEAMRRAVLNAREQAEAIAAAMGVPLGRPLEVHGGAQAPRPMPYMRGDMAMEMAQAAPTTPVDAADQRVSAQVSVKYAIGGSR